MQNRTRTKQYPAILIPEAINPERAISYARQNGVPTDQLPCVLIHDAINPGRAPSSNLVYLAILVHDTKLETLGGRIGGKS